MSESAEPIKRLVSLNLRRLRAQRGLTLEQLANRSDVSRAMLSQVETGKTTPTIAVLWKISAGLGVAFTEFLRQDTPPGIAIKRRDALTVLRSDDGHFRSVPLLSASGAAFGVELYRITIDPGFGSESPAHPAGTEEVVTVEKGRLALTVGTVTQELAEGDVATFAADVGHAYRALGRGPCVIYDVVRYGERPRDGGTGGSGAAEATAPAPKSASARGGQRPRR
jgi:transcriptional regulator with XRE-family HTH domain